MMALMISSYLILIYNNNSNSCSYFIDSLWTPISHYTHKKYNIMKIKLNNKC